MDPERFLTAAVMWYNRVMLLAADVGSAKNLRKLEESSRTYEIVLVDSVSFPRCDVTAFTN
jgi:hypothetical protein